MFHRARRVATDATSPRLNSADSLGGRLASHVLQGHAPMSDIFVTRHEKGAWTDEVFEALASLLGPGSGPGRAVLEHELLRCDLLYLASDVEGPCAFLLGARVRLPVGPERRPARYLGLSVARSDPGNDAVLERFTADARDEEESRGVRLVLFTAAATPLAVRTAETFWSDLQPAPDASFREDVLPLADAARAWLGDRQHRPPVRPPPPLVRRRRLAAEPGRRRRGRALPPAGNRAGPGRSPPAALFASGTRARPQRAGRLGAGARVIRPSFPVLVTEAWTPASDRRPLDGRAPLPGAWTRPQ